MQPRRPAGSRQHPRPSSIHICTEQRGRKNRAAKDEAVSGDWRRLIGQWDFRYCVQRGTVRLEYKEAEKSVVSGAKGDEIVAGQPCGA